MLQLLPMIAGLLENQQKAKQAKQQAAVASYMGDKAPPQAQGGGASGLLSGLGGLLQGSATPEAKPGTPGKDGLIDPWAGGGADKIPTYNQDDELL